MGNYSAEALGQVVRDLRDRQGITQEQLGRDAGYQKGAGVSISRLEGGLLRPGAERFAGVAKALGLTPTELEERASQLTTDDPTGGTAATSAGPRGTAGLKERERRIQQEITQRTILITELSDAFNAQHDRARDEFFLRFVDLAARVEGAPQPDPTKLEDEGDPDADTVAAYRLESASTGVGGLLAGGAGSATAGAAVGTAAAYGTYVAVASVGAASTGAAISGLSGVAATNATLATLGGGTLAAGGAGVAGGTMVLASLAAGPVVLLTAVGLLWMAKRTRKRQMEIAAKLDQAEVELAASRPGVQALQDILPRATQTLDYIATHGGHALHRWADHLGAGSMAWDALDPAEQRRYQDFIDIAAAQLTLVTINVQGVLTTRGDDQAQLIRLADEVLTQSQAAIEARV